MAILPHKHPHLDTIPYDCPPVPVSPRNLTLTSFTLHISHHIPSNKTFQPGPGIITMMISEERPLPQDTRGRDSCCVVSDGSYIY